MMTTIQIEKNWLKIRERMMAINGSIDSIKVIPVTKSVGVDEIKSLISLGFNCFAENRIEILNEKRTSIGQNGIQWDFIGNIQSRKIPEILKTSHLIHSVCNSDIILKINSYAGKINKIANILLQINIANESQKSGFSLIDIKKDFSNFLKLGNIRIKGLMTMAPLTNDHEIIRKTFKELRILKNLFQKEAYADFQELSMGMSNDFEIALQEGATMLRIGSLFFKEN